jgi:hypothetical protein
MHVYTKHVNGFMVVKMCSFFTLIIIIAELEVDILLTWADSKGFWRWCTSLEITGIGGS